MWFRTLILFFLMIAFTGTSALGQNQAAEGGDYLVTGTELDGREYTGGLEILQRGERYQVSYQLGTQLYGAGILLNDVFVVASGDNLCITAAYERTSDGFAGRWTSLAIETVQTESMVIISSQDSILDGVLTGENVDGSRYQGAMTITQTSEHTVEIEQVFSQTRYSGTGIIVGDVLAVALGDERCSVAAYTVQSDGSLAGNWTSLGETRVATETAVPVNITGLHRVSGTNQDGSQYSGTLDVSVDNQVHYFRWVVGGATLEGVGILRGNVVTAAFGNQNCAVMSYFVLPNGSLSGQWAFIGTDIAGSELAVLPDGQVVGEDQNATYDVTGTNPDTTTYTGRLTVQPNADGETLSLTWVFGNNPPVNGVGIRSGNMLLAGFGSEGCGVNFFSVLPGEMTGPFAQVGLAGLGSERAVR